MSKLSKKGFFLECCFLNLLHGLQLATCLDGEREKSANQQNRWDPDGHRIRLPDATNAVCQNHSHRSESTGSNIWTIGLKKYSGVKKECDLVAQNAKNSLI